MPISITNLGSSAAPDFEDNVDRTSYANASWTPPSADNCIILLWVYNTRATNLGVAGAVSGNGLTWTQQATVGTDPGAQTHRLTCYAAISTGTASAGQTTVDFSGDTQSSIIMEFQQVTGVDLRSGLAGAIIQEPTNSSNSATSLAVTLSAAGSAKNRFVVGIGHGQNEGIGFEAGWDELDDLFAGSPGHQLAVAWDSDSVADVTPSASWSTAGAALGIAIEIKAAPDTYNESVTLGKVSSLSLTGTLGFADAISLENTRVFSLLEAFTSLVTKGTVATNDFRASSSSPAVFSQSTSIPADLSANTATKTDHSSSTASTSDGSASSVETEDL